MPKVKLVFSEERTRVRAIEVEVPEGGLNSTAVMRAAEIAVKAYQEGKYDALLEAATEETESCRNEVARHNEQGEYQVLLPWD